MESKASQSPAMDSAQELGFKDEIAAQVGALDLAYCFQCGTCSGSCPTANLMEYGPRRIMQMVHLGMADKVLHCRDIWMCVSCYLCAARCPQSVKVADIMAVLRNLAIASGQVSDKEATLSKVFLEVIRRYGRMHEAELLLRYHASEADPIGLLKLTGIALKMMRKGKISLRPERIEHVEEVNDIFEQVREPGTG